MPTRSNSRLHFSIANLMEAVFVVGLLLGLARVLHAITAALIVIVSLIVFAIRRPTRSLDWRTILRHAASHASLFWGLYLTGAIVAVLASNGFHLLNVFGFFAIVLMPLVFMASCCWLVGTRRYEAFVLFLAISPMTIGFVHGIVDYVRGDAVLPRYGMDYDVRGNPDLITRLQRGRIRRHESLLFDWVHDVGYEDALIGMTRLLGPMEGTYDGPYLSKEEACRFLREHGVDIDVQAANENITIDGVSFRIPGNYGGVNLPAESDPSYNQYTVQVLVALWRKECLVVAPRKQYDVENARISEVFIYSLQGRKLIAHYEYYGKDVCEVEGLKAKKLSRK